MPVGSSQQQDLHDQLVKMKRDAEERDAQRRAQGHGHVYLPPEKVSVSLDALGLLDEHTAREGHCALIAIKDKKVALVAYDEQYSKTKEVIAHLEKDGYTLVIYIVSLSSLEYALGFYRFVAASRTAISGSVRVGMEDHDVTTVEHLDSLPKVSDAIRANSDAGKISQLMETILMGAIANRASDIHIEPTQKGAKVRYRIDGLLNDAYNGLSLALYRPVISRIKLLSNLKINIRDEAQDGRFTINLLKKNIEVRVAIAPSEYGEVAVMRILDPDAISLQLSDLGIRADDLVIIQDQLKRPNGMALNTGPTGSGKTTTLYAFLKHRLTSDVKIITIEDPIEYHLDGIEQTQVDNAANYTFALGLRSLMRQDPDIILVGEIRDKETAEIAVQAALTGHLVFSTVHANEAAGGIARLLDLGVKANSLAPALNLLIAQRLVRRLCPHCKVAHDDPDTNKKLQDFIERLPNRVDKKAYAEHITVFEPKGCEQCNGTGYRGRVGVYELLVVTPTIQELISKNAGQIEILAEVEKGDFVSMQDDGILKIASGMTTFEEVEETTGKIMWR